MAQKVDCNPAGWTFLGMFRKEQDASDVAVWMEEHRVGVHACYVKMEETMWAVFVSPVSVANPPTPLDPANLGEPVGRPCPKCGRRMVSIPGDEAKKETDWFCPAREGGCGYHEHTEGKPQESRTERIKRIKIDMLMGRRPIHVAEPERLAPDECYICGHKFKLHNKKGVCKYAKKVKGGTVICGIKPHKPITWLEAQRMGYGNPPACYSIRKAMDLTWEIVEHEDPLDPNGVVVASGIMSMEEARREAVRRNEALQANDNPKGRRRIMPPKPHKCPQTERCGECSLPMCPDCSCKGVGRPEVCIICYGGHHGNPQGGLTVIGERAILVQTTGGTVKRGMGRVLGKPDGSIFIEGTFNGSPSSLQRFVNGALQEIWYYDRRKAKAEGKPNPRLPWRHEFSTEQVSMTITSRGLHIKADRPLWGIQ